jgi:hypothetical protein
MAQIVEHLHSKCKAAPVLPEREREGGERRGRQKKREREREREKMLHLKTG